jgi:hypothetical protein
MVKPDLLGSLGFFAYGRCRIINVLLGIVNITSYLSVIGLVTTFFKSCTKKLLKVNKQLLLNSLK